MSEIGAVVIQSGIRRKLSYIKVNRMKKSIIIQRYIRRWLCVNNNIYSSFKNPSIRTNFEKELIGYHIINNEPLKESVWEEINRNIVSSHHIITEGAHGNHLSGKDNKFDNWKISNKTSKMGAHNKISISSYRLSSVCDKDECGNMDTIMDEINKRDASFDYYSILIRDELNETLYDYHWYIIPKDYYVFNVEKFTWDKKIGKQGKNKGKQTGWTSKYKDITFSMSSQLWFYFTKEDISKYLIHNVVIDKSKLPKIKYSDVYDKYMNQ